MIELFSADTPNGKKISIMLEEISFKYKVTTIRLRSKEGDFSKAVHKCYVYSANRKIAQVFFEPDGHGDLTLT